MKKLIFLVFKLIIFITPSISIAMPKYIMFSPVNGVITMNGLPVTGAKVNRSYEWGDDKGADSTITDKNGEFKMPPLLTGWSIAMWIPHEVMIMQTMTVQHNGIEHKIWGCRKGGFKLNSELEGREIKIHFQLELEKQRINPTCAGKFTLN